MNKSSQLEVMENGKGIQYLLDNAYRIFQNPICIHDLSFDLIAYTDVPCDDPIWDELTSNKTIGLETKTFYAEKWMEDVANSDKAVLLKSDRYQYERIVTSIVNRDNIKVAYMIMVASGSPIDKEDIDACKKLAEKIESEIFNDGYYTTYGRLYHEILIKKLLEQSIEDTRFFTGYVQILYDGFDDYLYLAVVDVLENDISQIRDMLQSKFPSFKFAVYFDYIVVILSSKYKFISDDRNSKKYCSFANEQNWFIGVSESFENIYELRRHYDLVVEKLRNGSRQYSGQRVF